MRFATALFTAVLFTLSPTTIASQRDQVPMDSPEYVPQTSPQPTLADLLTIEPSTSIFFSYARELELSSILSDQSAKLTLFVPTNKAVMALARKPYVIILTPLIVGSPCRSHEDPKGNFELEMTEEQFHKRSKKNVERWVSAHISLVSARSIIC